MVSWALLDVGTRLITFHHLLPVCALILPSIHPSFPALNLVTMSSYNHFRFLQHIPSSACLHINPDGSKRDEEDEKRAFAQVEEPSSLSGLASNSFSSLGQHSQPPPVRIPSPGPTRMRDRVIQGCPRPSSSFLFILSPSFFRSCVSPRAAKVSAIRSLSPTLFFFLHSHHIPACVPLSLHRQSSDPLACISNSCVTCIKRRIHFYPFPIFVLPHVLLLTFLNFDAI